MNMPLERIPGSDSASGIVEPQAQTADRVVLPSTADADRFARTTLPGNSPHTVSAIYPSRAEADGVRQHLIERGFAESAVRWSASEAARMPERRAACEGPEGRGFRAPQGRSSSRCG